MTEEVDIDISKLSGITHRTFYAARYTVNAEIEWEFRNSNYTSSRASLFFAKLSEVEATTTGTVHLDFDIYKKESRAPIVVPKVVSVDYAERPEFAHVIALHNSLAIEQSEDANYLVSPYQDLSNAVELFGVLQEAICKIRDSFYVGDVQ